MNRPVSRSIFSRFETLPCPTEFRKVREDHGFFEICQTPELATEITLQPIRRYSGLVDASIIFCDILVIPQAMGMEVLMSPGPVFPDPLNTPADIQKLTKHVDVQKELGYVFEAITMTRKGLKGEVPLIGFCGAPWTLFAYMIEGGGSKFFQKSKTWLFKYPGESKALIMHIADVCVEYLIGQVKAGAQVHYRHFVQPGSNCRTSSSCKFSIRGLVSCHRMTLLSSPSHLSNILLREFAPDWMPRRCHKCP